MSIIGHLSLRLFLTAAFFFSFAVIFCPKVQSASSDLLTSSSYVSASKGIDWERCKSNEWEKMQCSQEDEDFKKKKCAFLTSQQQLEISNKRGKAADKQLLPKKDMEMFKQFLSSKERAELLVRVFIYMAKLPEAAEPLCLSQATVQSIARLNGQEMDVAEDFLLRKVESTCNKSEILLANEEKAEKQKEAKEVKSGKEEVKKGKEDAVDGELAYMFGQEGLAQIVVAEEGYKCAPSLLNQQAVLKLLQQISVALKDVKVEEKAKTSNELSEEEFTETVGNVIAKLVEEEDKEVTEAFLHAWKTELKRKWKEANEHFGADWEKKWENIENGLIETEKKLELKRRAKKVAVWLVAPKHVYGILQILTLLSGVGFPINISLLVLQLFGLDKLINRGIEKLGLKLESHGANVKFVRWAFGPDGVVPLYIRQGMNADEEEVAKFTDNEGKAKEDLKIHKLHLAEEIEFFLHIFEEFAGHQGKPMHELMDHVVQKLQNLDQKIQGKLEQGVDKLKEKWDEIKNFRLKDVKPLMKRFAAWFVTPERVNVLINLLLAIVGLDTPVFLTLELIQAFGITDIIAKGLSKADTALLSKFQGKKEAKAIEFMFGEEGTINLFLGSGTVNEGWEIQERAQSEADVIQLAADVLIKHRSFSAFISSLLAWLVEQVRSRDFYLAAVQQWNKAMLAMKERWASKGEDGKWQLNADVQAAQQNVLDEVEQEEKQGNQESGDGVFQRFISCGLRCFGLNSSAEKSSSPPSSHLSHSPSSSSSSSSSAAIAIAKPNPAAALHKQNSQHQKPANIATNADDKHSNGHNHKQYKKSPSKKTLLSPSPSMKTKNGGGGTQHG